MERGNGLSCVKGRFCGLLGTALALQECPISPRHKGNSALIEPTWPSLFQGSLNDNPKRFWHEDSSPGELTRVPPVWTRDCRAIFEVKGKKVPGPHRSDRREPREPC